MSLADLHPAPAEKYPTDHRDAENRDQLRVPSEYDTLWKRVVESLAEELQIEPIEAHFLLRDASGVSKGQAYAWWLP